MMNSDLAISDVAGQFADTEFHKFFHASEIGLGQVHYRSTTLRRASIYGEQKE
jgi:hypothetical protein